MITALSLIIAFFRRERFIRRDTFWADKVSYYVLNIALTPIFGPKVFCWLKREADNRDDGKSSQGCSMMLPGAFM